MRKKNWIFTWQNGRQLATAEITGTGNVITNTYDVDGIRETKTVGGVTHTYTTLDGKVVREAYGNVKVDYLYDNTGRPYKLIVTEGTTKYTGFYILNLQGDVIGIVDTSGAKAITYEYSAWGTLIGNSTNGSTNGSKLNQYNALKYRGYYYDADLAMYYLGSRFYDTEICRFINADDLDYLGASGDFIGYNLYAYCANNPVNCKDEEGNAATLASLGIIAASGVVGCLVGAFTTAITGGDMIEGAIKGGITGAIGATVGVFELTLLVAAVGGGATDFVMQSIPLIKQDGYVDLLKINWLDVGLTAIETTLGAWIPYAKYPNTNIMNVGHTINSWTRASLVIGWGDVVVRSGLSVVTPKSVGNFANGNAGQSGTTCRIPTGMTTADYFRQCYSNY